MNEQTGGPASGAIRCPAKIRGKGVRVQFKEFDDGRRRLQLGRAGRTGGKRFVGSIEVVVTDDYDGTTYSASIPFTKVIRR